MSNSLAKKFDKIVSKLGSKTKESKSNGNETNDNRSNKEETTPDANEESQHESILQRVKGHLVSTHGSFKREHHQTQGAPPIQVIIDDLKDSPFKGKKL
ncbi:unnamed protein product [Rotaria sp. Silwood2]|nr:unnamed protein product [Rotaria sp. Silwood2]CAF2861927.1 unnamed protein product [Rotaria sp. Silwood2]CAF3055712.1 unnamed protein product [Rotaria sp. Silwood2]CAF3894292.1 unnamed protein product [Rotaria sp. Silwood2]CAF4044438.1 unnamed protein product [Rotaria sp. Silwood2]